MNDIIHMSAFRDFLIDVSGDILKKSLSQYLASRSFALWLLRLRAMTRMGLVVLRQQVDDTFSDHTGGAGIRFEAILTKKSFSLILANDKLITG